MLAPNQIRKLAHGAGWRGRNVDIAVAVAWAESKGRTCAVGDVSLQTGKWGPSIGLFQIRSLNAERGTGSTRDQNVNSDPRVNLRHAYKVWQEAGGSWRPWSTWLHGTYRQFL